MDGLGFHHMWGMSPAVDFNEFAQQVDIRRGADNENTNEGRTATQNTSGQKENTSSTSQDPDSGKVHYSKVQPHRSDSALKVLLIKPADIRSILKTVSQRQRLNLNRPIHFYIWEDTPELLARHLLLLQVFQDWAIPIRQRSNLFLEIFGNVLVQERTMHYIDAKGRQLVKLVCDQAGPMARTVDTSLLKSRIIDTLQNIFKSWSAKVPFNARELHEYRLRGLHKERFDFRQGAADWDYHAGLKDFGASIVHMKQYRKWRESGVAFEFGDQTYTNPNRSMASYMLGKNRSQGLSKMVKGLWTDVVASPYISFGIDCHKPNKFAEDLFYIVNKGKGTEQHRHNTAEVACYNMASYMHETETGTVYCMNVEHQVYSGLGMVKNSSANLNDATSPGAASMHEHQDKASKLSAQDGRKGPQPESMNTSENVFVDNDVVTSKDQALKRARCIAKTWDGIKVFFLGGNNDESSLQDVFRRQRYKGLFDIVWVANLQVHNIAATQHSAGIQACLAKPAAAIMAETLRHVVTIKKELKLGFLDKVEGMAEENGWTSLTSRSSCGPLDPDCKLEYLSYICKSATRLRNIQRARVRKQNMEKLKAIKEKGDTEKKDELGEHQVSQR